ncbi:MAG: recombinase family protein [Oscillospiraceae bacterium]|nr:recombinase family protein [Oscillospiraceae bacterium]
MQKKRVYALYRVSTLKQVDKDKDDIPMQKQACQEFISARPDWELYNEISEKGVSGFKVSAKDRDAIQEIQKEAVAKKFDVLLVFMFDRLGRKDDETPFIVEWFVQQGIEVWSVKEGEQRFDHHVDKLTNYIRYWQASGESIKTSMRTKTRLSQIVQEGRFRGGTTPYGYRLEKQGRFNKKNHELYEIVVDKDEAAVVRKIFELYVSQGYGSQRLATHLTEQGILNRKGSNFTNGTVNNMLKNNSYTGVLKSGETVTDIFPQLQIIDPDTFEMAQNLLQQRSTKNNTERTAPLNTRGSSLLSGNVFCGHCGARLTVTTNGKKYRRKDGEVTVTPRTRYVCYNKTRHKHLCDGQTGYTVSKLDKMIDEVIHRLFERLNDLPKEYIIEERYAEQIAEIKLQLTTARAAFQAHSAEVMEYEAEVIKIIRGESKLHSGLLNKLYEEAKEKAAESEQIVLELNEKLKNSEEMRVALSKRFDNIKSWSDMYEECGMETKKMILSHIMKAVRVSRDYEIEIDLTVDIEQLGLLIEEPVIVEMPTVKSA